MYFDFLRSVVVWLGLTVVSLRTVVAAMASGAVRAGKPWFVASWEFLGHFESSERLEGQPLEVIVTGRIGRRGHPEPIGVLGGYQGGLVGYCVVSSGIHLGE